jgi:SAM-dependent methyltransferase
MASAKEHYENHLARHYSWMMGNFTTCSGEFYSFFKVLGTIPHSTGIAIDLGAGNGLQSIPLACLGFSVIAIDFSRVLLEELKVLGEGLAIQVVEEDILNFPAYQGYTPELVVCMTDTILHLSSSQEVQNLIRNTYKELVPTGRFIISFRPLAVALQDEARFIPVQQDENKLFTCFLEYYSDFVKVFDIIHSKQDGVWTQQISSYQKLRLTEKQVVEWLEEAGFILEAIQNEKGFSILVAKK